MRNGRPFGLHASTLAAIVGLGLVAHAAANAESPRVIRFERTAPRVGDRMAHDSRIAMSMQTTTYVGGRESARDSTNVVRQQRRVITAREVRNGRVVAARVTFEKAAATVREGSNAPKEITLPVSGKTYDVRREGDSLTITDPAGDIPPIAEYEVVLESMASIGQPNPLANFLAGRRVAIGQTLAIPFEVATAILGPAEQPRDISRFDLTLRETRSLDGREVAVFAVRLDSRSAARVQMGMQIEGELFVETATSRTIAARLAGPVGLAKSRGAVGAQTLVTGRGKFEISLSSRRQTRR